MTQMHDISRTAPYKVWGRDYIDVQTLHQMELAARLPITGAAR